MTKLIKSSLALALVLGMSLSAAETFKYSGTGGFDSTNTSSPDGFTGTVGFLQNVNTSAMTLTPPIEGNPQNYSAVGNLWPMVAWGTIDDPDAPPPPPAVGKSALGLVPYSSTLANISYDATIEADSGAYTPVGAITHYNVPVKQAGGIITASIVWNIKIWNSTGTQLLLDHTQPFPFGEWETNNDPDYDEPHTHTGDPDKEPIGNCPRAFVGLMSDAWSYTTMGEQWTGDGNNLTNCDDAARYIGDSAPQAIGAPFPYGGKNYQAYLTGFYDCEDSAGIYHPLTQCNLVPTFWQPEGQNNTAYVMLSVKEVERGIQGCTPGYWKQYPKKGMHDWPAGSDPETLFSDSSAFGCVPPVNSGITLGDAIGIGGGGENALLRHSVAALLNARSSVEYAFTETEVTDMTCDALNGITDIEDTKDEFEGANEGAGGCPLGKDGDGDRVVGESEDEESEDEESEKDKKNKDKKNK